MAIYRRTQDYESNKALLILSIVVLVAGILILFSSFMTWTAGQNRLEPERFLQPGKTDRTPSTRSTVTEEMYISYSAGCARSYSER